MAQTEDEDPAVAGAQSQSWVFDFASTFSTEIQPYRQQAIPLLPLLSSGQTFFHAMQKTAMQFPLLWVKIKDKDILLMLSPQQNTFAPRIGNQSLFSSQGLLWLHGSCPSFQLFHVIILFFLFLLGCKITKKKQVSGNPDRTLCATDKPVNEAPLRPAVDKKTHKTFLNWCKRCFAERASMA